MNRPKSLNALTRDMIEAFTYFLDIANSTPPLPPLPILYSTSSENSASASTSATNSNPLLISPTPTPIPTPAVVVSPSSDSTRKIGVLPLPYDLPPVECILISSCIPKAYCAGGDVVQITDPLRRQYAFEFFTLEYFLHQKIIHSRLPVISFLRGFVLGGGVGMSIHSHFRVVTDTVSYAMPETKIGYIPDIAATYFLPRFTNNVGLFLSLTSLSLKFGDVLNGGVGTHYIHDSSSNIKDNESGKGTGKGVHEGIIQFLSTIRSADLRLSAIQSNEISLKVHSECAQRLCHLSQVISSSTIPATAFLKDINSTSLPGDEIIPYSSSSDPVIIEKCPVAQALFRYLNISPSAFQASAKKHEIELIYSNLHKFKQPTQLQQSSPLPSSHTSLPSRLTVNARAFIDDAFEKQTYFDLLSQVQLWSTLHPIIQPLYTRFLSAYNEENDKQASTSTSTSPSQSIQSILDEICKQICDHEHYITLMKGMKRASVFRTNLDTAESRQQKIERLRTLWDCVELALETYDILKSRPYCACVLSMQLYRLGRDKLRSVQDAILVENRSVMRMLTQAFSNSDFIDGVKTLLVLKAKHEQWTDFDQVLLAMLRPEQSAMCQQPHSPSLAQQNVMTKDDVLSAVHHLKQHVLSNLASFDHRQASHPSGHFLQDDQMIQESSNLLDKIQKLERIDHFSEVQTQSQFHSQVQDVGIRVSEFEEKTRLRCAGFCGGIFAPSTSLLPNRHETSGSIISMSREELDKTLIQSIQRFSPLEKELLFVYHYVRPIDHRDGDLVELFDYRQILQHDDQISILDSEIRLQSI